MNVENMKSKLILILLLFILISISCNTDSKDEISVKIICSSAFDGNYIYNGGVTETIVSTQSSASSFLFETIFKDLDSLYILATKSTGPSYISIFIYRKHTQVKKVTLSGNYPSVDSAQVSVELTYNYGEETTTSTAK